MCSELKSLSLPFTKKFSGVFGHSFFLGRREFEQTDLYESKNNVVSFSWCEQS